MPPESLWSIGELAEQAGVTVKTVRFYSDRGLLPEATRSTGGHRRYSAEALDRLRVIRSLRTLGLPIPDVHRVLDREDTLEDIVAGQLRETERRLAALHWQEAATRLLQGCSPTERAERLRLVGAVSAPPSTASLARFWRGWLPPRLPARLVSGILEEAIPTPPPQPTPDQVLAFTRLHAFVSGPCHRTDHCRPAAHRPGGVHRPAVLYDGLREAYALAAPELRTRRPPRAGEALDCFVAAYAGSRGVRDTDDFRRRLSTTLAGDPRIDRYWQLTAEVRGPTEPTAGAAHDWLCAALDAQLARTSD